MEHVYPAVFCANSDGSYTVTFPDLPGCVSEGKTLANAVSMAQSAVSQWLGYLLDKKQTLPAASNLKSVMAAENEFVSLVRAETKDRRAVKRTVSIPAWMDTQANAAGLSLSRILQDALTEKLQ
ncbi:MAG: type II toxin-antitoxin system HicB family antitoxin [Oscillospiraceae bacterium]|jgi:predicted RNase H-like HicB family nuclease|nr:type II toxin-antitoxin system HicB family antitoxin [Oscillospiraceae bacterium]